MLLTLALASTLMLHSCQEGHEAGTLLGQWKCTEADNRYMAFSGSIVLMRAVGEGEVFGNFQHVGDSVFIQCYSINGDDADRTLVEQEFGMKPFHNIRMRITTLSSDALVLTKDGREWHFTAY